MKGGDGQWHIPPAQMTSLLLQPRGGPIGRTGTKAWSPGKRVLPLPSRMRAGYASSLSAFSGGHAQCSSPAPVTTASPAPRTGITNADLARATPPVVMKRGLEMSLRD